MKILEFFGSEHILKRVKKRPQIRVYFFFYSPRKKTEIFTGLDDWAGENDLLDPSDIEHMKGHTDREKGLAGSCGPYSKCQVIIENIAE